MNQLPFVGRENEQLQFKQIIRAITKKSDGNELYTNVVLIYGVGGMGKSTLCRRFLEIANAEYPEMTKVYIDWWRLKTGFTYTPAELLDTIYNELRVDFSKQLEPYIKAKKDIKVVQDEIDKILERDKGLIESAQPIATTIATATTGNPTIGAAVSGGLSFLGKWLSVANENRLKHKWGVNDEKLSLYKTPEEGLANHLIDGINKITSKAKHKILLVFDTCEVMRQSEEWLMNRFLVPMLNKNQSVILVYSGRDNTYTQRHITINEQTTLVKGFADILNTSPPLGIEMKLFSEVDIRKYLTLRLNTEVSEKAVQFVQKLSRGVPYAVDLLTNAIQNGGINAFLKNFDDEKFHSTMEITASNEQVIKNVAEKFLFYCFQSDENKADLPKIFSIAILKDINQELLKEIWQVSNPASALQTLQGKYSFFTSEGKLHETVQEFIEEYLLKNEPLIVKEITNKALPFYRSIYESECKEEPLWKERFDESPLWRKATYNLLNCLRWYDPDLAADFFIKRGIELLLFNTSFALELKKLIDKLLDNNLLRGRLRKQVIAYTGALADFHFYSFSEKTLILCQKALEEWQLDPIHYSILQMIKGRMQYHQNDYDGALNTLLSKCDENVLEKSGREKLAETLDDVGKKFCLDANNFYFFSEKSLNIFQKVLQLNDNNCYYNRHLGLMLYLGNEPEKSLIYFQKAIELKPKEEYIWNDLGDSYRNLGRYEEAITEYQKVIEINPKSLETYCRLSGLYIDIGELEKAEEECSKALQIDENHFLIYNCFGNIESAKGNFRKSIEHFQTCIEKKPTTLGPPYNNIGEAYSLLGDYEKATEFFNKAIEHKSENATTGLGSIFLKLGKLQDAERLLLQAIEKQKYKSTPKLYLAITYLYLGETVKANNYFNDVISFSDKIPIPDNQFNKVTALLALQKSEEAENILKQLSIRYKITPYIIKSFMYDLALLESAPSSSERVKEFIKKAKAEEVFTKSRTGCRSRR